MSVQDKYDLLLIEDIPSWKDHISSPTLAYCLQFGLNQKLYDIDILGLCVHASPIDFNTAVTAVWPQSKLQQGN